VRRQQVVELPDPAAGLAGVGNAAAAKHGALIMMAGRRARPGGSRGGAARGRGRSSRRHGTSHAQPGPVTLHFGSASGVPGLQPPLAPVPKRAAIGATPSVDQPRGRHPTVAGASNIGRCGRGGSWRPSRPRGVWRRRCGCASGIWGTPGFGAAPTPPTERCGQDRIRRWPRATQRGLSETIMQWGRSEQDRVGIDGTTWRPITICARIQRGVGAIQGGKGAPTTEVAARLRRGHSQ
jgi:hypothetical protein